MMFRPALGLCCCGLVVACAGTPIESGSGTIGGSNGETGTTSGDPSAESTGRDVTTQGPVTAADAASVDAGDAGDASDASDPGDASDAGPGTEPDPTDATGDGGSSGPSSASDPSGDPSNAADDNGDGAGPCDDGDEPNENYQESEPLGQLACNGGVAEHSASIEGATAPDWFYYAGVWANGCGDGDGEASVTFTDGADLQFCLMATCHGQLGTQVGCTAGAPDGNVACCGTGTVSMNVNCSGTNWENADIDIIVQSPGAACRPYTFEYSY